MKRTAPFTLSVITGSLILIAFFVKPFSGFQQSLLLWYTIVGAFALVVGLLNLIGVHLKNLQKGKNIIYSSILLLGFFGTLAVGIYSHIVGDPFGTYSPLMWIYGSVLAPLQSTMFSLLAFFLASAAFRAFRIRNMEALLLLISALIVMLGRIPWSEKLFAGITEWIMSVPNLAAQRGIQIGIGLGAMGMAFRILFGLERPYLR